MACYASTKVFTTEAFESACISGANRLLEMVNLDHSPISSVQDIGANFIVAIFERISGFTVPAASHTVGKSTEIQVLQSVIDCLSSDLLGLSLSHISAESIDAGDSVAVLNLLEILEAVSLHLVSKNIYHSIHTEEGKTSSSSPPLQKVHKRAVSKTKEQKLHRKQNKKPCFLSSDAEQDCYPKDVQRRRTRGLKTTRDINDLLNFNFETRVEGLVLGSQSPHIKCQQLRKAYLKDQKPSSKDLPVCNRSYLLPYNLRKRSYQQKPSKVKKKKATAENVNNFESENAEVPSHSIKGLLQEFPGFQFSSNTENLMARDYHRHLSSLHKQLKGALLRNPETLKQEQLAKRKQALLSEIFAKDLKQRHVLRKVREEKALENKIRFKLRDAQLKSARIKLYFDRYHRAMQKKLQQPNTEEEQLAQRTFEKMLQRQKAEVRSLCVLLKEADQKSAEKHLQYLEALENTYQSQYTLLAEIIRAEQSQISDRDKENAKVTEKWVREWRTAKQKDILSLQRNTLSIVRDIHFRALDANKLL